MNNIKKWTPHILTILRVVIALLFLEHGTMKLLQFPGPAQGIPYPLPTILLIAGLIEVVTGALLTIGFYTRVAAFIASGEMAAAYWMAHAPQGFWPAMNMGEPAIMFCFIFLYLAFAGPGSWALDNVSGLSPKQASVVKGS
jgi:putative oxidoreductase